jgi:opacity protein-like surface antigen
LCAGSGAALAEGTYLSIAGGGAWTTSLYDEPKSNAPCPTCGFKELALPNGFAGAAALGFVFAPGFRLEGELGLRSNRVDYTVPVPFDATTDFEGNLAGRAAIFSAMLNAWIDIPTGSPLTPYIGAGVGAANVKMNFTNSDNNAEDGDVNAGQTVFAYQLGAGAAYAVTPEVSLTLDYRFIGTSGVWLPADEGPDFGVKKVSSQSVMIGLRFNLGPHSFGSMAAN